MQNNTSDVKIRSNYMAMEQDSLSVKIWCNWILILASKNSMHPNFFPASDFPEINYPSSFPLFQFLNCIYLWRVTHSGFLIWANFLMLLGCPAPCKYFQVRNQVSDVLEQTSPIHEVKSLITEALILSWTAFHPGL